MNKTLITKLVVAVVLVVAIAGAYLYPKVTSLVGFSTAGSTFSNAKFAGVTVSLATAGANGTSTSILNTDANDRFVTGTRLGCNGVGNSFTPYTGTGLSTWTLKVGTTTSAAPISFSSWAAVSGGNGIVLGTSTVNLVFSSSTLQTASSSLPSEWPANTYMTFYFNATNTASCTVGVDYIGS